jgi:outer membrane protein G
MSAYDYGLDEKFSIGVLAGYVLCVNEDIGADFGDWINLVARFNANIGSVLNIVILLLFIQI